MEDSRQINYFLPGVGSTSIVLAPGLVIDLAHFGHAGLGLFGGDEPGPTQPYSAPAAFFACSSA